MRRILFWVFFLGVCMYPAYSRAALSDLSITEIMYDADGSDVDHEWIEVHNGGSDPITIPTGTGDQSLRMYEEHGSTKHNHTLSDPYQGSATLPAGGFAIIAQDGATFKSLFPSYTGTIFTASAMSLSNTTQTIGLKIGSAGSVWSSVSYSNTWGATGDGKSLQIQGGQWSAAVPTPGEGVQSSSLSEQVSPNTPSQPTVEAPKSLSSYVSEPKFKADIIAGPKSIVGAPTQFEGQVFGYQDREIDGGRFLWSFGDGTSAEGRSVQHVYKFPGAYMAALNVSSGRESVSDYMKIVVVPNSVYISEVTPGVNGFVELANASADDVLLGSWAVENETTGVAFSFPQNMVIGGRGVIAIPTNDSKVLEGMVGGSALALMYPNNTVAMRVILPEPLGDGQSIGFDQSGNAHVGQNPTPGSLEKSATAMVKAVRNTITDSESSIADTVSVPKLSREASRPGSFSEAPMQSEHFAGAAFSGIPEMFWVSVGISAFGAIGFFFVRNFLL